MRKVFIFGIVIVLLALSIVLTLKRPGGDAATSVVPTQAPIEIKADDLNTDGVVDERDAALRH